MSNPFSNKKVNLESEEYRESKIIKKKSWVVKFSKFFSTIFLLISFGFFGAIGFVGWQVSGQAQKAGSDSSKTNDFNLLNLVPAATNIITGNRTPIQGEKDGRTNFLLIGLDPDNGASDTLMVVSLFHKENKLTSINIPRDFYITDPSVGSEKINAIYPLVRNLKNGDKTAAANYLSNFIGTELKIPMHYWVMVNVNGLRQAIDVVGGVDINVENTFTDFEFPTDGYTSYLRPAPTFKQGTEHMDGFRASVYARSRHSNNAAEGSDFARSRRQSIVIQALLNKIKSQNNWENLTKINDYIKILGDNVTTTISTEDMISIGFILKKVDLENDFLRGVWQTGNGFLCSMPNNGQGYSIGYGVEGNCSGTYYGGQKSPNKYKSMAQDYVGSNMIANIQKEELRRQPIKIYAYKSTLSNTIITDLQNQGYEVVLDNNFKPLAPAVDTSTPATTTPTSKTATSVTPAEVSIYIQNTKTKSLVSGTNQKFISSDYKLVESIPEPIKTGMKNADFEKEIVILIK